MFPDYKLSLDIVKPVPLAHLDNLAGAQPAELILRALRINRGHEILGLTTTARTVANWHAHGVLARIAVPHGFNQFLASCGCDVEAEK
jgi:hypothetical protein